MLYFDNNATTRVIDEVVEVMAPFLTKHFANPASAIGEFDGASNAIVRAKSSIARLLGAEDWRQIIATSGATESNNLALLGAARANPARRHIITSAIEHPSVRETLAYLATAGYDVTTLPVSKSGLIEPEQVAACLRRDTLLVSLMLANNETGVIQPLEALSNLVKGQSRETLVHTDATQAVGKIGIDLDGSLAGVDLLSFSGHKFHGPKGVGGLFVREAGQVSPLFFGGGQQAGLRPGTENPATLLGMARALEILQLDQSSPKRVKRLRDLLEKEITTIAPTGSFVLGGGAPRLPNTSNLCLRGMRGSEVVDVLAAAGVAISTGSACSHGADKPSHVALAMGLGHDEALGCIRLSLSFETTEADVQKLIAEFATALAAISAIAG